MANILFFGDSITQGFWDSEGGWVTRIRHDLDAKSLLPSHKFYYSVFNQGISGNTSEDLLNRFESEIKARLDEDEETVIVIAIGINDSYFTTQTKEHQVPIEDFRNNLQKLLTIAQKYSNKIFFIGLTPCDESKTNPIAWSETKKCYKNEYIEKYDSEIKDFCKNKSLTFIDTLKEFKSKDWGELLEDGLHPNSQGHQLIFEMVREVLSPLI